MKSRPAPGAKTIRACALNSAVSAVVVLLLTAMTGRNPNPQVLPPAPAPYGRTYGDWAAAWWSWALQFPLEQNPMTDPTGAYGSAGQKGPVWFLADTLDGSAERSITIPAGKRIFFPLFNVFNDYSCPEPDIQPAPGQTLEEFLTESAEAISDMATELFAELDGVPIQNLWDYRTHSTMMMFTKHPSLLAFDPCLTGGPQPAVVAGYWLMLAPLTKGQHTLRFGSTARLGDFEFGVDVIYFLTVG
ncbi:MAG TPA: hypothetical protein VFT34_10000 [Verrucomicrobiae bacterium]|nr:hypothetical protein [Verrucomicrobiae bacterium]